MGGKSSPEYRKKYAVENKESINARARKWYADNRERAIAYRKQDYVLEKNRTYLRLRYADPSLRMQTILQGARSRSKKNNIQFDEQLFSILMGTPPTYCACCNKKLDYSTGRGTDRWDSPSLDRFDNNGGYTVNNTFVLCWKCNHVKSDSTAEELETVAAYVRSKQPSPLIP